MKTLYLDCGMGAAGDMLGAALLSLIDDREGFLSTINAALDGRAVVRAEDKESNGVHGLHLVVDVNGSEEGAGDDAVSHFDHDHEDDHGHDHNHNHDHGHTSISELRALLADLPLSEQVRADAVAVFDSLAEAESEVHGCEMENVHFHEVGSIDAVADVLSVCLLMEQLAPEQVLASPINVGGGTVNCSHGVLPVPAPATERLLRGLPYFEGEIKSELCTPTGAALLRHFANGFGTMPTMTVERCGYGLGKKEFERLNVLRAFWGESEGGEEGERLIELSCNLDDMTGEEVGFALEELFAAGALDAWTSPIGMKKGRPGVLLSCLGRETDRETLLSCFFRHTTTLGVRVRPCARFTLSREIRTEEGPLGETHIKRSEGYGVVREKPEYEDLASIAREHGLSLREVKESFGF